MQYSFIFLFLLFLASAAQNPDDNVCGCSEVVMCPLNSNTTGLGASSIDDCICNPGFVDVGGGCVKVIDCPLNTHSVDQFAFSEQECVCDLGYVDAFTNRTCVKIFECPLNSSSAITYPLSVKDCACDSGFTLLDNTCQLTASAGLSVTAIAGIAAGSAALAGGGLMGIINSWNFLFPPTTTPVPPVVGPGVMAGIRMDDVFTHERFLIRAV